MTSGIFVDHFGNIVKLRKGLPAKHTKKREKDKELARETREKKGKGKRKKDNSSE
jgi:hypothetical protein